MSVAEEIKQQLRPGKLCINGRPEDAESGRTIDVINPATGELLTTVPDAAACDWTAPWPPHARVSSVKHGGAWIRPRKRQFFGTSPTFC